MQLKQIFLILLWFPSDSKKILNICSKYKNIILHKRSKKLSNYKATVNEVCLEVLKFFKLKNFFFDFTCCLYATSPLRKATDIKKSFKIIKESKNDFVIAVSEYNFPPHQALFKDKKYLKPLFPKLINKKTNSAEFKKIYVDNGSTYFARTTKFLKNRSFYGNKLSGYFMKREVSIDIDTKEDFNLLKKLNNFDILLQMTKIIYGTANFNSDYGILKSRHVLDRGLNKFLLNNHINTLDTALIYKYNNKNLNLIRKKNWKIISKLKLPETNKSKFLSNLENNIRTNLNYLKKKIMKQCYFTMWTI